MKRKDVFFKCYMPAGVCFGCVWIIEEVTLLVLWITNKYCRNGSWMEFIRCVLVNISPAAKYFEVIKWWRVIV